MDGDEIAIEWVDGIDLSRVRAADKPYIQRVLVEAAQFEDPIPELNIGIVPSTDRYIVTIQGYKKMQDDVIWCNTFLGKDRDPLLGNVFESKTQLGEGTVGITKVLHVKQINMQQSKQPEDRSRKYDLKEAERAIKRSRGRRKRR